MTDRARPADVPSSPPDAPAVRAARLTSTLRTSATTNAPRLRRGGGAREAGGERSVGAGGDGRGRTGGPARETDAPRDPGDATRLGRAAARLRILLGDDLHLERSHRHGVARDERPARRRHRERRGVGGGRAGTGCGTRRRARATAVRPQLPGLHSLVEVAGRSGASQRTAPPAQRPPRGQQPQPSARVPHPRVSSPRRSRMSALTAFPTALAVASSAARPRAGAARASRAARARDVVRSDARLVASPSRRGVRCAAEKGGEAEKTVSALDAILAGSQDEPEPEPEVRDPAGYRRPDPSVAIHHLHHHPTPVPVRVPDVCPFLASRGPAAHPRPFLPYPPAPARSRRPPGARA